MNKVKNWSIVSAIFFAMMLAAISLPYVAIVFAALCFCSAFMALTRYEDAVGYKGKFSEF